MRSGRRWEKEIFAVVQGGTKDGNPTCSGYNLHRREWIFFVIYVALMFTASPPTISAEVGGRKGSDAAGKQPQEFFFSFSFSVETITCRSCLLFLRGDRSIQVVVVVGSPTPSERKFPSSQHFRIPNRPRRAACKPASQIRAWHTAALSLLLPPRLLLLFIIPPLNRLTAQPYLMRPIPERTEILLPLLPRPRRADFLVVDIRLQNAATPGFGLRFDIPGELLFSGGGRPLPPSGIVPPPSPLLRRRVAVCGGGGGGGPVQLRVRGVFKQEVQLRRGEVRGEIRRDFLEEEQDEQVVHAELEGCNEGAEERGEDVGGGVFGQGPRCSRGGDDVPAQGQEDLRDEVDQQVWERELVVDGDRGARDARDPEGAVVELVAVEVAAEHGRVVEWEEGAAGGAVVVARNVRIVLARLRYSSSRSSGERCWRRFFWTGRSSQS